MPKQKFTGTIAFCSGEAHVEPGFANCLSRLTQRHPHALILHLIGTNLAQSRNKAMRDMQGDWLWFIDTDMVFAAETLERLLAHNVDMVQSLCLLRHPPHYPVLYGCDPRPGGTGFGQGILAADPPRLQEVEAVGTGGVLIRRHVRDAIADPWFEVGQIKSDELGEDLQFAKKVKAAGFKMWVDLTTPIGHMTPISIWPVWREGKWVTAYKLTVGEPVMVEAAT